MNMATMTMMTTTTNLTTMASTWKVLASTLSARDRAFCRLWTKKKLVDRLYLCDCSSIHRDATDERVTMDTFSKALDARAPEFAKPTGADPMFVGFVKDAFDYGNRECKFVWSIPSVIFNSMLVSADPIAQRWHPNEVGILRYVQTK